MKATSKHKGKVMRINKLLCSFFVLAGILMFSACDPENYQHPEVLVGKWVLTNSSSKDAALNLTFDGDYVTVRNGSWDYRPFTNDIEWEYYMTKDSVLCISHTEYDGDGYETESHELDLSFSDSYNTLTLWYKPTFSALRKYTLIRR